MKSENEVKIERIRITPTMAKDMLGKNFKNRPISRSVVTAYVAQMDNGQWREDTSETIKFSTTGELLDGQHRLTALVIANKPFYFHVARNITPESFTVLDTGKKRNAADVMHMSNVPNAAATAASITSFLINGKERVHGNNRQRNGITNKDVIAEYESRPNFWNYLTREGKNLYRDINHALVPAQLIGWWATFCDIDKEKGDDFIKKLCTGLGMNDERHPIYQLRRILMNTKSTQSQMRLTNIYKTALIIKAWNYYVQGTQVKFLKYDEKVEITFPKLIKNIPKTDEEPFVDQSVELSKA